MHVESPRVFAPLFSLYLPMRFILHFFIVIFSLFFIVFSAFIFFILFLVFFLTCLFIISLFLLLIHHVLVLLFREQLSSTKIFIHVSNAAGRHHE